MAPKSAEALSSLVELLPKELGNPAARQRLRRLADDLDESLAVDPAKGLSVDSKVLTRMVRNNDIIPPKFQDQILNELQTHIGDRLVSGQGKSRVRWSRQSEHGSPTKPVSARRLREQGVDPSLPVNRVREALRQQYPEIPAFWLDADASQIQEAVESALAHNQTVWDCCVRRLGWWGALWVFAAVGAALIVGTATGPWGTALAVWLIGVLGGGTATIVFNCLLNPSW